MDATMEYQSHAVLQGPTTTPEASPFMAKSDISAMLIHPSYGFAKRRAQNRAAQRRFRFRKELQKQHLQQTADDVRTEYKSLIKEYTQRLNEMASLRRENEVLRFEVRNLREQWRLVLGVFGEVEDGAGGGGVVRRRSRGGNRGKCTR
ncbi:hypothetical protein BJX70DRAFT_401502 [Aspergillus crustosus]